MRRAFFVAPTCGDKDYAFYMSEEAAPAEATVAVLVGVHPKAPGQVYKEVVLFKHHRCVHIYKVCPAAVPPSMRRRGLGWAGGGGRAVEAAEHQSPFASPGGPPGDARGAPSEEFRPWYGT